MKTIQILLIDSDDISVLIAKRYFSLAGHHPEWKRARGGWQAVSYFCVHNMPDLIFLDPVLPDMSPDEIFRQLDQLEVFTKTRVCLLTTFLPAELDAPGLRI